MLDTDSGPDSRLAAASWAHELLREYRSGDFFFASPRRVLLGRGVRASLSGADTGELRATRRAGTLLERLAAADGDNPVLVGAVPFAPGAPGHLVVPERLRALIPRWAHPSGPPPARPQDISDRAEPVRAPGWQVQAVPAPERYRDGVARAISRARAGALDTVVLARTLRLTAPGLIDVRSVLRHLVNQDASGYTFAVPLPPRADSPARLGARTLVGASPELLVSRTGMLVTAQPMAGGVARHPDPATDRARAAGLLDSAKDRRQHAVLVDAVRTGLRPYCASLRVADGPTLVRTPTTWRLGARITGAVADPAVSALDLAAALHPTPGVCGAPRAAARALIDEVEPFDRGFYTGALGWCDARGDGEWVVATRCAEVADRSLRLFASASVGASSQPAEELARTTAEFRALLRAMGLDRAG